MIKANELRLGNFIKDGYEIESVAINHLYMLLGFEAEFDPIPLTEEWLLKFGFIEIQIDETFFFIKNNFVFESSGVFGFYETLELDAICINNNRTSYVHQLQNLYFALTGEELTLK